MLLRAKVPQLRWKRFESTWVLSRSMARLLPKLHVGKGRRRLLILVDEGINGYQTGIRTGRLSMCRFLKPSGADRLRTGACITLGL